MDNKRQAGLRRLFQLQGRLRTGITEICCMAQAPYSRAGGQRRFIAAATDKRFKFRNYVPSAWIALSARIDLFVRMRAASFDVKHCCEYAARPHTRAASMGAC